MKIVRAIQQHDFVIALFASLGTSFNLQTAFDAKDESALKTHLDAQVAKAAKTELTAEEVSALVAVELRAQLGIDAKADPIAAIASLKTAASALPGFVTGLAAAGIKLDATATAEQVTKAANARIEIRSGEKLGSHGIGTSFPADEAAASPATASKDAKAGDLKGFARVQAAFTKK